MDKRKLNDITNNFVDGEVKKFNTITSGNINSTYLVNIDGEKYVLQKINTYVFHSPDELMSNIYEVTEHLKQKVGDKNVLSFLPTKTGDKCCEINGEYWRLYKYISHSFSIDTTNDLNLIYEAGLAFGEFQKNLNDFDVSKLYIVIPHFHNTVKRFNDLKQAIEKDEYSRLGNVKNLVNEYLELENIATKMYKMQKSGELSLRVTHNDTKCNNVLFDETTRKNLVVIDLDTIMPGLIGFDYGDAIRSIATFSNEEESNMANVFLDVGKFKAFTEGFLHAVGDSLSENEKKTMVLGAITMTIECGTRFLTDYLNGDVYFKINYADNNLVRVTNQLTLAKSMIKQYDNMNEIVYNILNCKSKTK